MSDAHQLVLTRLKRCREKLQASDDLDFQILAESLQAIENGVGAEIALDLKLQRGQHDPRHELRRKTRDDLLRQLADIFYPGVRNQAKAIHEALKAYERRWVRRDHALSRSSYSAGSRQHFLFEIFSRDPDIKSEDWIYRLLSRESDDDRRKFNQLAGTTYFSRLTARREREPKSMSGENSE